MNQKTLTKKQQEISLSLYEKGATYIMNKNLGRYYDSDFDKRGLQEDLKHLKQMINIVLKEMEDHEEIDL
jgi:hypothetical protein